MKGNDVHSCANIYRKKTKRGKIMVHIHEWEKIKLIEEYYDDSGFQVCIFVCRCKTCGMVKKKKFIRVF